MKPKIITIQRRETDPIAFNLLFFGMGMERLSEEIRMEDLVVVEILHPDGNFVLCPTAAHLKCPLQDGTTVYLLQRLETVKAK